MERLKSSLILIFVSLTLGCFAGQTNAVKTNFIKEAKLSSVELNQVLSLAKESGIQDAEEVVTFNYLPSGGRGIRVKSKERVDGRNISYDTILIGKDGWDSLEPDKSTKRLGNFCIRFPKDTTLLRTYELNKKTIRIAIGEGVNTAFADKVIPLIASKKVRFEHDYDSVRNDFKELGDSSPVAIFKSHSDNEYVLRFNEPRMKVLMFKLDKGEVVVTGVGDINI